MHAASPSMCRSWTHTHLRARKRAHPHREPTGRALRTPRASLQEPVTHRVGLIHTEHNQSRFRHTLAQEAVYDGLPPPTRKWAHRAAAEELSRKTPVPIAQVVHHYRAASDPRFLDAAEVAADKAVADGHDATAARFLLQAMDADGIPDGQHVRLALKLGRCAVDGLGA